MRLRNIRFSFYADSDALAQEFVAEQGLRALSDLLKLSADIKVIALSIISKLYEQ
jgi:hypothetical protein